MSTFKSKVERVKEIFSEFENLEKSVQVQLMDAADKLAPMVQGGGIAPKTMTIPEPVEYPAVKISPVSMKKHAFEAYAEQFAKGDWQPIPLEKAALNTGSKPASSPIKKPAKNIKEPGT